MIKFRHLSIILVLIILLLTGVIGYQIIEGWNFHDSLYMTIISLTTAGFQEVHLMSDEGRNLTMFLLVFGMGTVAYSATVIMSDILSINFGSRRIKKMEKEISKLKGHIIVCGYGRMGKVIVEEISKVRSDVIIIEKDPIKLKQIEINHSLFLEGDATHDDVLLKANIKEAKTIVSLIDNDADGLYLSLAARSLNPKLEIIVRASEEDARSKILRAGANKVILPVVMSGMKVAQAILNPAVEDYIDLNSTVDSFNKDMYQLADIVVSEKNELVGKSLKICEFQKMGMLIVGIKRVDHEFVFAPDPSYKFCAGDVLLSLATKDNYQKALNRFHV